MTTKRRAWSRSEGKCEATYQYNGIRCRCDRDKGLTCHEILRGHDTIDNYIILCERHANMIEWYRRKLMAALRIHGIRW